MALVSRHDSRCTLIGLLVVQLLWVASPALAQPATGTDAQTGADTAEPAPPPVTLPGPAGQREATRLPRVTFSEAVRRALARNPSAAVAQADIARAEALVRQAAEAALPTLTGTFSYTRLDSERRRGELVVAGVDQENANINLSVPLVQTKSWLAWSRSREGVAVARASAEEVKRQLALAAGRSYLAVLAQHRSVEVNQRALETARAHLAFARRRLAAGAGNRLDETRAAQEAATDEAQVQNAQAGLARAQQALGVVLAADGPLDVEQEPSFGKLPAEDRALEEMPARRGDIQAQAARVRQARRAVRDGWTDYMPFLTGTFQPFYQNPPSLVNPQWGWQAQLVLTLPLYDGGLRYGLQRERRAELASAQARVEALLRQARSEVRTAFAVLQRADMAARAAREAARLGQQAFDMANRAYQAGATNSLDLIDAARRARDAETAAVAADDAARQARLDLLVAAGRFP
jgi:outer membrane protein TolC